MPHSAVIFGCAGPKLSQAEADFFRAAQPWGFILFGRNVESPEQLRRLTGDLRAAVGWNAPILIDQEGGRVQRLRPPHWRAFLPALEQMERASDALRAQWLRNRLIAADLAAVGIDVNCAPLADLVEPETHESLRGRLYGETVAGVVAAANAAADGLLAGGVLPVLKHIPGYGRANVDSHLHLPTVTAPLDELLARDFAPFIELRDMAMGMTAHVVYTAIDPELPATVSPAMIALIRQTIGFDGLLMSDDVSMNALSGTIAQRAAATVAAGVDLALHCNGDMVEMEAVAGAVPRVTVAAVARAARALGQRRTPDAADLDALWDELQGLINV
ncbi:beta-N-acetylhexosaminidase [Ketogulonicigenium robustum]|uniref:beta-N-acetylhexosaminidase n=1 Tax=Ketogulonicigenium robustum TaxID=92947 RepID=A0A1W6P121_9RHOB|nr:glycoside hydrolase family 3 N-terminal domain-containing protein [Ketogulonicigenium robustum]ARO15208.1 beta-N-acetylhexosaminidase [Ketogulonicigenium robustum]